MGVVGVLCVLCSSFAKWDFQVPAPAVNDCKYMPRCRFSREGSALARRGSRRQDEGNMGVLSLLYAHLRPLVYRFHYKRKSSRSVQLASC